MANHQYALSTFFDVRRVQLTAAELLAHPAYQYATWPLKPAQEGKLAVKKERGGYKIAYEVHGTGDIKLVWIMGLGAMKEAWQRQTRAFGHDQGDKYSCLIIDNIGMGESDKPLQRYTTSSMATDTYEILEHLGWTSKPRSLHIIGVSMGGMIAQEFGMAYPSLIASLCLISTAAQVRNTVGFYEHLRARINMFVPKTVDESLRQAKSMLFPQEWLEAKDGVTPFTEDDVWPTNGDRFGAQELKKRLDPVKFTRKGFMLQAIGAGWHVKTPAQLKEIGDKVGRDRVFVMHGDRDRLISPPHVVDLENGFGGRESGITVIIKEGGGHALMGEDWKWFNETIEEFWLKPKEPRE